MKNVPEGMGSGHTGVEWAGISKRKGATSSLRRLVSLEVRSEPAAA